jgi:hypothetical protein
MLDIVIFAAAVFKANTCDISPRLLEKDGIESTNLSNNVIIFDSFNKIDINKGVLYVHRQGIFDIYEET